MSDGASACMEAVDIVSGARREEYGAVAESFERVAAGWSAILGTAVEPRQVALMMVWLKMIREAHRHKRDNLVDMAGYTELADVLEGRR